MIDMMDMNLKTPAFLKIPLNAFRSLNHFENWAQSIRPGRIYIPLSALDYHVIYNIQDNSSPEWSMSHHPYLSRQDLPGSPRPSSPFHSRSL